MNLNVPTTVTIMATRSLTEVFILMRNNALQNRHIFSEQNCDDRQGLVSGDGYDAELGIPMSRTSSLPPDWVDSVDEVQYDLTKIKQRMKELSVLHDKHMNRPTLDDSIGEEQAIEIQTQEITQMFHRCQRTVQQINQKSRIGNEKEQKLTTNIVSSLARSIQDLSLNFRRSQSNYLKKLKSREERAKQFFDVDLNDGYAVDEIDEMYDRGFTSTQMQVVEDNSTMVLEREKEIKQIVRSIHDLNEIFKDLAGMIVDQGTILDRIDFNIEQTSTRVEQGLKHLQKAEKYQKKNRKMMIIVVLFVVVILLVIILIAVKS